MKKLVYKTMLFLGVLALLVTPLLMQVMQPEYVYAKLTPREVSFMGFGGIPANASLSFGETCPHCDAVWMTTFREVSRMKCDDCVAASQPTPVGPPRGPAPRKGYTLYLTYSTP